MIKGLNETVRVNPFTPFLVSYRVHGETTIRVSKGYHPLNGETLACVDVVRFGGYTFSYDTRSKVFYGANSKEVAIEYVDSLILALQEEDDAPGEPQMP